VEGIPDASRQGVLLTAAPALVSLMAPADVWPHAPPIRERKPIATCWLAIRLQEGATIRFIGAVPWRRAHLAPHPLSKIGTYCLDALVTWTTWRQANGKH